MEIKIRQQESTAAQPFLLPDSTWDQSNFYADWKIAGTTETGNIGGLQSLYGLQTAVILCLFTWKRAEDYELAKFDGNDPKGWWGDAVDLQDHETELGSKLWLLLRSVLNDNTAVLAKTYAVESLQSLIAQKVVAKIEVDAEVDIPNSRLDLRVRLYSEDGTTKYDQKFEKIWRQIYP